MDLNTLIAEKQSYIELIRIGRENIAKYQKEKAEKRGGLWEEAQGTVDAKKDYIKSKVADLDFNIAVEERDIEYYYNMIDLINDKMVYLEDE